MLNDFFNCKIKLFLHLLENFKRYLGVFFVIIENDYLLCIYKWLYQPINHTHVSYQFQLIKDAYDQSYEQTY